jgi:hypothetical protein
VAGWVSVTKHSIAFAEDLPKICRRFAEDLPRREQSMACFAGNADESRSGYLL